VIHSQSVARGREPLKSYREKGYVHNAEIACSLLKKVHGNERRNRLAQVDTIDKDVSLLDFVIRSRLDCLVLSEFPGQHGSLWG